MINQDMEFFKNNKGYRRLFEAFRKKYKSLGRIGGSVKLINLSPEEKEILTSHFRKDYTRQTSVDVSLLKFEESLKNTKFEGYTLKEILEAYFGEPLTGKKEDEETFQVQKKQFFERLYSICRSEESKAWLEDVYEGKAAGARAVETRLWKEDDRKRLFREMEDVCRALDDLPVRRKKKERLAVFASRITQNPHAFDFGTAAGNLFFNALLTVMDAGQARDSRDRVEVYYRAGILMDEISNFITVAGLRAFRGDVPDPVWEAAYENGEVLQVPLLNLSTIDRVASPTGKVFVVENPGIFSSLIDASKSEKSPRCPLICTFGQPRLSAFVLLDLLADGDMQIYYSGDFDPEGLLIADRLFKRYENNLKLWHYNVEDYEKCLSRKTISEKRLSMLKNLACPELAPVARHMLQVKKAGYQELLIDDLAADVSHIIRRGNLIVT
ncbi:MAG TPA: TIGR02679 family protein [Thermoanaerobacterales bacterium]|nr:TIGR02679 family protein [Thermoanaerobacterales bacterium]